MACLFCNGTEKSYTPDKGVEFICGACVQLLLRADQADLKRAHGKAIAIGYLNKVSAIESFLILEVEDGKRPANKSIKRSVNRKGIVRNVRA